VLEDAQWGETLSWYRESAKQIVEKLRRGEMSAGARQFIEEIALGLGGWDRLPEDVRQAFVYNAPTWLDEQSDPEWDEIDLDSLAEFPPVLLTRGDLSQPYVSPIVTKLTQAMPRAEQRVIAARAIFPT
jgi:hypothetical protein